MNRDPRCFRTLLYGLLALAPGCVLPIGPEFAEETNVAPFVVSVVPPEGSAVTAQNPLFTVTIQDPNPLDTLYATWLIDYPPFNAEITRRIPVAALPVTNANGPNQKTIRFTPDCRGEFAPSPTLSHHRLMLVVADRPFLAGSVEDIPTDGYKVTLTWGFEECRE